MNSAETEPSPLVGLQHNKLGITVTIAIGISVWLIVGAIGFALYLLFK